MQRKIIFFAFFLRMRRNNLCNMRRKAFNQLKIKAIELIRDHFFLSLRRWRRMGKLCVEKSFSLYFYRECKERVALICKEKWLISYNKRLLYRLWTIFFINLEGDRRYARRLCKEKLFSLHFFYACKERRDLKRKESTKSVKSPWALSWLWTIFFIKLERDRRCVRRLCVEKLFSSHFFYACGEKTCVICEEKCSIS